MGTAAQPHVPAICTEARALGQLVIVAELIGSSPSSLNGLDWRARWDLRLAKIFATQIILVGEQDGEILACATGTYDRATAMGFVDLLAVVAASQGSGLGREMLRGIIAHFQQMDAAYIHLDCLTTNEIANRLYAAEGFDQAMQSIRWIKKI